MLGVIYEGSIEMIKYSKFFYDYFLSRLDLKFSVDLL